MIKIKDCDTTFDWIAFSRLSQSMSSSRSSLIMIDAVKVKLVAVMIAAVEKKSTKSMDSLDNVHGLPGHFPWPGQYPMDTLDKVQGAQSAHSD